MKESMPKILNCDVTKCAYNHEKKCTTPAINVGSRHPNCDTYFEFPKKGGVKGTLASVGSCKEVDCQYNKALECAAPSINVGLHEDHADCMTFNSR